MENTYNLLEMFNTIQGEGSTQGLPVTLIRFPKCNLRCPFCISYDAHVPFVYTNTKSKKMSSIEIDDVLITLDDDGNTVNTTVTDVLSREADDILIVKIERTPPLRITSEHPFRINGSWVEAKDLKQGDLVTVYDKNKKAAGTRAVKNVSYSKRNKTNIVHNIHCEPYNSYICDGLLVHNCDTWKRMEEANVSEFGVSEIIEQANTSGNLLITGGEPTLYIQDIIRMLNDFYHSEHANLPYNVIFETNGTNLDSLINELRKNQPLERIFNYVFSWSPKFYSQALRDENMDRAEKMAKYNNVEIKLVIDPNNHENESEFIKHAYDCGFDKSRIWLMPMGATFDDLKQNLYPVVDMCHELGVNLSPRLHILFGQDLDVYFQSK